MKLLLAALVVLVSSVLRSSSATNATLQLPSDLWENSTTQINCTSNTVGYDINNIIEVRFWKIDNSDVYFVYAKQCGANAFSVVNDTTGGRIAFTTSTTVPTWHYLATQDSGLYKCSLMTCSNEVQVSDSVVFTVHKYNAAPRMYDPYLLYVGSNVGGRNNYTFNCTGFTGYPAGKLRLIEFRGSYLPDFTLNSTETVVYSELKINETGYATFRVRHEVKFEKLDVHYLYCETYKVVGADEVALQSNLLIVDAWFPPTLSYRLKKTNQDDTHTDYFEGNPNIYINDVGTFELMCSASSNPNSTVTFWQTLGLEANLKALTQKTVLIENTSKDKHSVLQFQCSAEYKQSSGAQSNFYNSTVTVYLNSKAPGSGSLAASSGAILVLAFAVLQFLR